MPIICSLHPRTKSQLIKQNKKFKGDNIIVEPLGFFDFIKLEKNAKLVLTDSGTVQEECCIFNVPNITLRDVTERPETIEKGSNIIVSDSCENLLNTIRFVLEQKFVWVPPPEYLVNNVSKIVLKIILGYY